MLTIGACISYNVVLLIAARWLTLVLNAQMAKSHYWLLVWRCVSSCLQYSTVQQCTIELRSCCRGKRSRNVSQLDTYCEEVKAAVTHNVAEFIGFAKIRYFYPTKAVVIIQTSLLLFTLLRLPGRVGSIFVINTLLSDVECYSLIFLTTFWWVNPKMAFTMAARQIRITRTTSSKQRIELHN